MLAKIPCINTERQVLIGELSGISICRLAGTVASVGQATDTAPQVGNRKSSAAQYQPSTRSLVK
jgi:hypothetical protein